MPFSVPLWAIVLGTVLPLAAWFLYEYYLHPAWRKQRRVIRACEMAFTEGGYRLMRLRVSPGEPSVVDLFPSLPFNSDSPPRYFTYKIETLGETEPDFSGMRKEEISLVRHYLHRTVDVPHYGKEVLQSKGNPAGEHSRVPA